MGYAPLANLDIEKSIQRIAAGTLSKTIAAEYGVTPHAVRNRLAKHPDYAQAVKSQAQSLVEQATEYAMSEELDRNDVPIARVRVEAAHKWAAAVDPERWAGKGIQINVGAVLNLDPAQVSSIGSLLDAAHQMAEKIIDKSEGSASD